MPETKMANGGVETEKFDNEELFDEALDGTHWEGCVCGCNGCRGSN